MSFLLLGIDSLIACIAIGALIEAKDRVRLAALFGLADGVGFLIGAGLGWAFLSGAVSEVIEMGALVVARGLPARRRHRDDPADHPVVHLGAADPADGGQPHLRHRRRADGLARR